MNTQWYGWWDLNPHALRATDFKSAASTIPPHPLYLYLEISFDKIHLLLSYQ